MDGDLYYTPLDCDDENAEIHPGAQEVCDGVDNDCDGSVDEFTVRTLPFCVFGERGTEPVRYTFNESGDAEEPVKMPAELSPGDEAAGLLMLDLDGDGIQELLVQSDAEHWIASYTIQCSGDFEREELFITSGPQRLRGHGDVDGDGDIDLVTFSPLDWTGKVWLNEDGDFFQGPGEVDWGILSGMESTASLADSQTLLDVTGDGLADWMMCYGYEGETSCYLAEGQDDGSMSDPIFKFNFNDVEASSMTLGYFTDDDTPDMILGLTVENDEGSYHSKVYKLEGKEGGGFQQSPDFLFDLAEEITGTAWGYDPDELGNGWFRTVDLDRTDSGLSELIILTAATRDNVPGVGLIYVKDPVDVDPSEGIQQRQLRALINELVEETSSYDPSRYSVVAAGTPVE